MGLEDARRMELPSKQELDSGGARSLVGCSISSYASGRTASHAKSTCAGHAICESHRLAARVSAD